MSAATPKRVLFLQGSSNFGGSKRALLNLIEAIPAFGYEPVVACPARGWLTEQLERLRTPFVCVPFFAWRKLLERPRVRRAIRQRWLPALAQWQFHIVHSNEFWWTPHAVTVAENLGIPAVVHLRDGHHDLKKAGQYRLACADKVLACSTELREKFRADGLLYEKTEVLYDGTDPHRVCFDGDREQLRSELGLAKGVFVIGNVGRLCDRKNQRLLLRSLHLLKSEKRLENFVVLFAGEADPEYEQAMRRDIEQFGLQAQARILGSVQEMAKFYAAVDLLVHCSRREGLPLVVTEAMLAGKPVVGTAAEGARDAVPDDQYGLVVPVDDAHALAAAVRRMAADARLRESVATRAHERALSLFTLEAHAGKVCAVYDALAAKDRRAQTK